MNNETPDNKKAQDEPKKKWVVTPEQLAEIMTYPPYYRPSLQRAVENSGESVKEIYEQMKGFEAFM